MDSVDELKESLENEVTHLSSLMKHHNLAVLNNEAPGFPVFICAFFP